MTKTNHTKEVEKAIKSTGGAPSPTEIAFLKNYIGTEYTISGLSIPSIRELLKTGFSFSTLNAKEQCDVWEIVWQTSDHHEALTLAILFWQKHVKKIEVAESWNYLKNWTGKIDNWAHSDGLSALYSHLLEAEPKLIFPQLKKWNTSNNPWERRQSVVGLIYYDRTRSKVLPYKTIIPLVENLLEDKDYFVQKGVGWTLRELSTIYHKETLAFLKKNYARITSVAFSAAAEKLSNIEKEELKALRKKARKKQLV